MITGHPFVVFLVTSVLYLGASLTAPYARRRGHTNAARILGFVSGLVFVFLIIFMGSNQSVGRVVTITGIVFLSIVLIASAIATVFFGRRHYH